MRTSKTIMGAIACASVSLFVAASLCFAQDSGPKFENFDLATYQGKTGSISMPCAGQSTILLRKFADNKLGDYLQVRGKEKSVAVPVGTYKVQYCSVSLPGKDGTTWSISAVRTSENDKPIHIKAGKSIKLPEIQQMAAKLDSDKTGTVILPYQGQGNLDLVLQPTSPSQSKGLGYIQASCSSNQLTIPVGNYSILQYVCSISDKEGVPWLFTCSPNSGQGAKAYEVKEGQSIKLDPSEPFNASINVKQDGDKLNLSLAVTDADGRSCTVRRSDGKGEVPSFQVLSSSGEVLMSGKFQYG